MFSERERERMGNTAVHTHNLFNYTFMSQGLILLRQILFMFLLFSLNYEHFIIKYKYILLLWLILKLLKLYTQLQYLLFSLFQYLLKMITVISITHFYTNYDYKYGTQFVPL